MQTKTNWYAVNGTEFVGEVVSRDMFTIRLRLHTRYHGKDDHGCESYKPSDLTPIVLIDGMPVAQADPDEFKFAHPPVPNSACWGQKLGERRDDDTTETYGARQVTIREAAAAAAVAALTEHERTVYGMLQKLHIESQFMPGNSARLNTVCDAIYEYIRELEGRIPAIDLYTGV